MENKFYKVTGYAYLTTPLFSQIEANISPKKSKQIRPIHYLCCPLKKVRAYKKYICVHCFKKIYDN